MKTSKAILLSLGMTALLAACDHHKDENPTGSWTTASPISVTQNVAGASSAMKSMSIDFVAPTAKGEAGLLTVTADYDVTATALPDSASNEISYKVTASIKGSWAQAPGEHDEYLLAFDKNTLSVNGTDAPELGPATDEFLSSISRFTEIDDVKVAKDGTRMKFETSHPEVKYNFVKK